MMGLCGCVLLWLCLSFCVSCCNLVLLLHFSFYKGCLFIVFSFVGSSGYLLISYAMLCFLFLGCSGYCPCCLVGYLRRTSLQNNWLAQTAIKIWLQGIKIQIHQTVIHIFFQGGGWFTRMLLPLRLVRGPVSPASRFQLASTSASRSQSGRSPLAQCQCCPPPSPRNRPSRHLPRPPPPCCCPCCCYLQIKAATEDYKEKVRTI